MPEFLCAWNLEMAFKRPTTQLIISVVRDMRDSEIINLNAEGGVQYSDILARFELASEMFEDYGI